MHSKLQRKTVEPTIYRRSWKFCSTVKTRARTPPPFLQPSCVLLWRVNSQAACDIPKSLGLSRRRNLCDVSLNRLRISFEFQIARLRRNFARHVLPHRFAQDHLATLGGSDKARAKVHGVAEGRELIVAAFDADRADEGLA